MKLSIFLIKTQSATIYNKTDNSLNENEDDNEFKMELEYVDIGAVSSTKEE